MRGIFTIERIVSFNLTSFNSQLVTNLDPMAAGKVTRNMCHSTAVRDKFYVAGQEKKEAFEARELRLEALKLACEKHMDEGEEAILSSSDPEDGTRTSPVETRYCSPSPM